MSDELICTWLGLPPGTWPPDHYTLLGLPPGEADLDRIEQHVHERLERVRRYQLAHPELVGEAMNRLAQAFVCLNDPSAKALYDRTLLAPPPGQTAEPLATAASAPPPGERPAAAPDPLAWLFGPWNLSSTPPVPKDLE